MQLGAVLLGENHVGKHVGLASSMIVASFGTFGRIWSATARPCVLAASGVLAFGGLIAAKAFDSNTIIADLNERGEPRSSSRSIRGAPCRCLSI
ncbi:hypothetical protein [Mesorhizobium sp. M1252]|uniref:hypothetical protein n=1 Tax=Mesorhizobium sp. M1252 TaxID=2957073 RepID=UPI003334CEB9